MVNIKYGKINFDLSWKYPTVEAFFSWREDFFKLPNSEKFNVYLIGSFANKLFDNIGNPTDIDIILTGNYNILDIENLIYLGTKIGMEKYNIFFDIQWHSQIVLYNSMEDTTNRIMNSVFIHGDKWVVNNIVKKEYKNSIKVADSLYKMNCYWPSIKQINRIKEGYSYKDPFLINP
jgi:hypothetical protein